MVAILYLLEVIKISWLPSKGVRVPSLRLPSKNVRSASRSRIGRGGDVTNLSPFRKGMVRK